MAKSTSKSVLAAKLGNAGAQAFEAVKNNEVQHDTAAGLPPGIEGGIAQLTECKFDLFKKGANQGQPYFIASGMVVAPTTHEGVNIIGLHTRIGPEPICATPKSSSRKTVKDHFAWVVNQLKLLGVETEDIDVGELEAVCEQLKEAAPYFRFRTWMGQVTKQFPNPRVNHVWNGACDYEPEEGDDDIDEGEVPADDEPDVEEPEPPDDEADEEGEDMELADIASLADQEEAGELDGEEYRNIMTERAEGCGLDPEQYDTWADLAVAIEGGGNETTSDSESEVIEWAKDELCMYKPPKARKASECEVATSNKAKQTCTLRRSADRKMFPNVPWSDMEVIEV